MADRIHNISLFSGKFHKKILRIVFQILISLIFIFVFLTSKIEAQIWSEDFQSDPAGSTQSSGFPIQWTSTPPVGMIGTFQVEDNGGNHEFVANNLFTGAGTWLSRIIDISPYSSVYISADIKDGGVLDAGQDTISLYYRLNNGPEVLWHMESDDFQETYKTVSVGNLYGNNLQVIIRMRNGDVDEHHFIDNIQIRESDTLFSIASNSWR